MDEAVLTAMMDWLSNLREQGFGRGDLPTPGDQAMLDNEQKMFMAFQQIPINIIFCVSDSTAVGSLR